MLLADSGIVTGAFTLGGGVLGVLGTLVVEKSRRRQAEDTRWDKERLLAYANFLSEAELHFEVRNPYDLNFLRPLHDIYIKARILASPEVEKSMDAMMAAHRAMRDALQESDGTAKTTAIRAAIDANRDCLLTIGTELGSRPKRNAARSRTT